ncbi:MAG TPA: two-component regulator propeller domain-containing protein [Bryobacteraceae bacterium]|nr:two-component regulator propeller domain-containing protein [Bryobacteraceae bacterium]
MKAEQVVAQAVIFAAGLLTSLWIAPAHAQSYPAQYVATNWQTEQGLPQNSVNALLQDHDGYLWLGTFGGLVRFDGERFVVFDVANTPGLGENRVLCLYGSRSGVLWIGTMDGLVRLENGVASRYTERDGLPGGFISSIREDAEGKIWINTSGGVAHFAGPKLEAYPAHHGVRVREFFLQARDGSIWFRSGENVLRFDADGSVATLHPSKKSVFLVEEARDGSVWIALRDQYLLMRYSHGAFSDVPLPPIQTRGLTGDYPLFSLGMAKDKDAELLLVTPVGVVRIVNGRLGPVVAVRLPASEGQLPKLRSLLVDREGNIWVGTIGTGLVRLRLAPLTAYGKDEGLSDSSFYAVFQDREGRIWLGGDSLYWFDRLRFHLVSGVANIRAIAQTRDGDLWFGGFGGLYRWRSGDLSHFEIEAPAVGVIYQDRDGTLWIGGVKQERRGGLYRFDEGKFERIPGASDVHHMIQGADGALWVGGLEGLFHMSPGQAALEGQGDGKGDEILNITDDSTGTLWLTTGGVGLIRFRAGRSIALTTRNGLASNTMGGTLEDGSGNLWANGGPICRFSLKELNDVADGKNSFLSPRCYGPGEGTRTMESVSGNPAGWKTTDGRFWFPTPHGAVAIDPDAINRPPPVILEEAWANKLALRRDGRTSVPPGNNTFDFRFTALSLSAPEKQRFKYRLEPYDKGWVDAGAGRTAHYTNMAPGEYSFHVIAANSFGVWNEQGAGVGFLLRPHFYQTNWFYALCAAALLTLLWMAWQFRLRQLQRAFNMRLEERIEERTRIARELHDSLLQSFQGLMFSFQAARNLLPGRTEEAIRTLDWAIRKGDGAVAEGRDAIQNLRVRADERRLEDLLTATCQELRDAQDGNRHSAVFQVVMEGQPRTLSPLLQDEIYRIAREVLRNAFQHACATRIEAAIHYDLNLFRLRIRDDGKGIDAAVLQEGARPGHWGLPGIRERAKRIGAKLALWSENGAGTEVELTVPASLAYAASHVRRRLGLFRIKTKTS